MLQELFYGFCDLIYPPHCYTCKEPLITRNPTQALCAPCINRIHKNIPPFCPICSRHLGSNPDSPQCPECRFKKPAYDFVWAACLYQDPLKHLIYSFKYHQKTGLRHTFAKLMLEFVHTYNLDIAQFDFIIPIPIHAARLRERGYNQARLLAECLALELCIPFSPNQLIKIRHTKAQTLLSRKERWTNIDGAFRINPSVEIKNKSILVVDDLLTTGATASEAAQTLKSAGAKTVALLTLAIALHQSK